MSVYTKGIRQAFGVWLTGRTAAGTNVRGNRRLKPWEEDLPALSVYTLREENEVRDESPRSYLRRVEVAVEAAVVDPRTLDTLPPASAERAARELDDLLQQCEDAIHPRLAFGGVALPGGRELVVSTPHTFLAGTEYDFESETGIVILGGARQVWTVGYVTEHPESSPAELAPFETIEVSWDLAGTDDALEASDTLKPEQPAPEV